MNIKRWLIGAALAANVSAGNAQQAPSIEAADSALNGCVAAASADDETQSDKQADLANARYEELINNGKHIADALTGRARVISQCRIPFAPLLRKGALIEDSNGLLKRALAVDSLHFGARYTLALNHYHVPEFFGRTDDAIRELEKLVAYHGTSQEPIVASVYLYLGDVYLRKGRKADAVSAWRRGQDLHPSQSSKFVERLGKTGSVSGSGSGSETANAGAGRGSIPIPIPNPIPNAIPIYDIEPLVVEAGRFSVDDTRGAASLKRMDIVTMPGGTADVLQVFQSMPGVTRATEGSDLYVRGGDPAEAPVFVDGARMTYAGAFETLHGGIFGVLDPNAIRKADFSSGGFSARYGNALSGVLDITTEGRAEKMAWRAGANLVSAGSSLRLPLGEATGLWATGKFTETSALLWTQGKGDEYPRTPWSVNGMAGITHTPIANVELKATVLTETDEATRTVNVLGYNGPLRSSGGTHMALLSARALNSEGTRSVRGTVSAARRSTLFQIGVLDRTRNDDMYTARIDGDYAPRSTLRVRAGLEGAALNAAESGSVPVGAELAPGSAFSVLEDARADATHVGGYFETEMNLTSNLAFIAGGRLDRLPVAAGWSADPRFAVAYRRNGWTVRGGAGLFHQGAWRSGYRTPSPGTPSEVATRARHLVVGIEREAPVFMRIEAYAKSYDEYERAAGSATHDLFAQGPAIDRGSAMGVDALMRWKASGALSGWASYSFLRGKVRLRDANKWIPSATDVHHTFTGVAKLAFGDNWEIGTTARLATGRPFTPITGGVTNPDGSRSAQYAGTHSARLPDYARLDTRLTRLVPTRNGLLVFYVEGLNLLDRGNIMAYTYDASLNRRIPVESFFANRTLVFGAEAMF